VKGVSERSVQRQRKRARLLLYDMPNHGCARRVGLSTGCAVLAATT
jgi:hypothetical protein